MKKYEIILIMLALLNIVGLFGIVMPEIFYGGDEIYHEILLPTFLGYILSYMFYSITVTLPESVRRKKIRTIINVQEYELYNNLIFLMEDLFYKKYFQHQIIGGKLKENDFELALQNKCLYRENLIQNVYSCNFIEIGQKLLEQSQHINQIIEKILMLHMYLSEEEICIVSEIRARLFKYDLNNQEIFKTIHFENQNISYMKLNYFELYELFLKIQKIVFTNRLSTRDVLISKIIYLYDSNNYEKCMKCIRKSINNVSENDKMLLEIFYIRCKYTIYDAKNIYCDIEALLNNKIDIVSNRDFFKNFLKDETINRLLKNYDTKNFVRMNNILIKEEEDLANFKKQNEIIRKKNNNAVNNAT